MGSSKTIVWFRRDLRIEDNPALAAAARDGCVFPVFIWCPKEEEQFYPGRVSSTVAALLDCIETIGATRVVFNRLYDPISLVRDHNIKEELVELGISVQSYNGDLLYEPWEIYDERGHAFTTFEAYWDKCLHMQMEPVSHLPPWRLVPAAGTVMKSSVDELGLEDEAEKPSNSLLGRGWSPGWSNADKALTEFVEHHLIDYVNCRLKVGTSTSLLSPYLHFGELSVRKVFQCVQLKQLLWAKEENNLKGKESVTLFLKSIGLREYSRYLCFNFPFTHERSLLSNLKYFPWNDNQVRFKAWRQGRTGYPLVDAGMRELWATGWIHNRIRVIVSSFAYISGSLPDGHELERLDSPEIQGSRFDPEGEYVRQWLPELARMPTEWIHHPWDATIAVLKAAGVELGINYPKPIIDLDLARERLMEAIFKMWELEAAARTSNTNGTNEVVVDNTDDSENLAIPKNNPAYRKRSKYMEDERPQPDKLHNDDNVVGTSRKDEDLSSTAESSSAKKQATSRCSFSVPQYCSSSEAKPMQECESSDLRQPWQAEIEMGQSSTKDGKQSHFIV
ncbi:hypothetical protein OIU84_018730 [Salix udensis]|uniref:Photolyase/cryptochrome alpha/beta domain-containing protein n=1 Tax=Salix udensis TaxID=889485 RepID=A0AAD6KX58_9ROSI|nr:hypothetical protein OIU84_018730 [Salix udensis]